MAGAEQGPDLHHLVTSNSGLPSDNGSQRAISAATEEKAARPQISSRSASSRLLADGYSQLSAIVQQCLAAAYADAELTTGVDVDKEAAALFCAVQGLISSVLISAISADFALSILDHQLDRLWRSYGSRGRFPAF